jgi:hypothetical protein
MDNVGEKMTSQLIMTKEEIHNFGVEVVSNQLLKEGHQIKSVNDKIGINPQIVAIINGNLSFIAVRTNCYPEKGKLNRKEHFQMLEHSEKHSAMPYFASVGIANADCKTESEKSIPVKGAGFHIAYNGLLIISLSDRVKIWDKDKLQNLMDSEISERE